MLIYRKRFAIVLHDSLYQNNNNNTNNNSNNNTNNTTRGSTTNNNNKLYLNTVKSETATGSRVCTYIRIQIILSF